MAKLDGAKVVVIGGASGVGFAVADAAMRAGANVVVGSSQAARIEAAAKKLAHRPMPGTPLTTASAHSTEGLAQGLARDLAPVRVNAVRKSHGQTRRRSPRLDL